MIKTSATPMRPAWQPLTFGGVAAFANASLSRLLLVQFLVALIVSASVVWFVDRNYVPVIRAAIQKMPEAAALENGKLTNAISQSLAETKFLSLAVDLEASGQLGQSAEVQIELHKSDFKICSLLRSLVGCLLFDYPAGQAATLGRSQLQPWWDAWCPMILVEVGAVVVLALFLPWAILAALYSGPIRLIGYFADRDLSWSRSWRLAGAAQMPGALFMAVAITLYGLGVFDLIALGCFWAMHIVIGWIYLLGSPYFVPRLSSVSSTKINPFTS